MTEYKKAEQYREVALLEVVITNIETRGNGTEENPTRRLRQIWTKEGTLIAEWDPFLKGDIY